jgi:hypothetical protein
MIRCGNCKGRHETVYDIRECYQMGKYLGPCTWLVEGPIATFECGAPMYSRPDGTGYDCVVGHEHTHIEARVAQGWDYAADEDEAHLLSQYGTEPRTMTGQIWPR